MTERWELSAHQPGAMGAVGDLWRHRKLLGFVGDRALRKIYRRTVLGWLWLFIIPLFPLALRALVFGALLGVTSEGLPYFLFLLGGTVVWDVFAASLIWGTRSLEMNRNLAEQVYVPRAILPVGNITPALLDFAIKVGVFAAALSFYALRDGRLYLRTDAGVLWSLAAIVVALAFALAISFFTAVWGETERDTRFALGQVLAVWYLLTPVLYPMSLVPEAYRDWMLLNPMSVLVETFKWALFGIGEMNAEALAGTAAFAFALLAAGLAYFSRAEARALDLR